MTPPLRFASVERGLYRSGLPVLLSHFQFIETLQLKTVISLLPDNVDATSWIQFCRDHGIRHVFISVQHVREGIPVSVSQMNFILQCFTQASWLPLLVHCNDGSRVTGCVIAYLRLFQAWTRSMVEAEYDRYARWPLSRDAELMQLLDQFAPTVHLQMNQAIPSWLWGGRVPAKRHVYQKIRFVMHSSSSSDSIPDCEGVHIERGQFDAMEMGALSESALQLMVASPALAPMATAPAVPSVPSLDDPNYDSVSITVRALALEGLHH